MDVVTLPPGDEKHQPAILIRDRKSTRLNSSHGYISYAGFWLKKHEIGGCSCLMPGPFSAGKSARPARAEAGPALAGPIGAGLPDCVADSLSCRRASSRRAIAA